MKINFIESNPIPVKAALAMMGKIQEVYRLPLVKISEGSRAKVSSVLASLGLTNKV
jgi:4-hydroxy-tetrahydrodipicolinate synthase